MKLRIGTRRSALALWQANHVAALLKAREPALEVELVEIVTRGDKILDSPLAKVGGKGLFVKEIEEQLLGGEVDLAVHSLKDMPAELPEGLVLGSIPEREDPRDAFVSARFKRLEELPRGARLGTSSLRRAAQLKAWRQDLEIVSIRGNVQTRIRKIDEELDGGILAAAGLKRLGLEARIAELLGPERMLPAVGQGALALEIRAGDRNVQPRVEALEDRSTRIAVACERAFLRRLGGGCQVPIAAYATVDGNRLAFRGLVGEPDGTRTLTYADTIDFGSVEDVERLGTEAAERIIAQGGAELLARVYSPGGVPES